MTEPAYVPAVAIRGSDRSDSTRHPAVVRVTHWITALTFVGLLISGIAILLAHPRLYISRAWLLLVRGHLDELFPTALATRDREGGGSMGVFFI